MSGASNLPDLLRRFVATPYRSKAVMHSKVIRFETNDRHLLATFRARAEHLASALVSYAATAWDCKLIRDHDFIQRNDGIYLLGGETAATLFVGTNTVVGIDWHRGELLGFVAANVSADYLLDAIVTVAEQHHAISKHSAL